MAAHPERIRTRAQLTEQLRVLFHEDGWSVHRMADAAGLSPATVQSILDGSTGLPRTGTLTAFLQACGLDPRPWVAARGRIVQAEKDRGSDGPARPGRRVVYLPYRAENLFVGRDVELKRLDAMLGRAGAGSVVVHPAVGAVHGLGGIGKSTLAAHWAHRHLDENEVTWWITADTATALDEGLAGLAAALDPAMAGQPMEVLTEHAVTWLAGHDRWLLVLDNVTRPADIEPLLGRCRRGRILVTSRMAAGWEQLGADVIGLDVLSQPEATRLLTDTVTRTRSNGELPGAGDLCRELGCLPLALEQAGAFIAEAGGTPRGYLDLLARYPADLYAQAPAGKQVDRTVARIWHATLDHLSTETPVTAHVLRVLAWFAPDHIPRALLDPLADELGGPVTLEAAVGRLAAYNMITLTTDADTGTRVIEVHRLVQAIARLPDPADRHRQETDIAAAREHSTIALLHQLPGNPYDPAGWPGLRTLLPHITALADRTRPDADTAPLGSLLHRTAAFLQDQGTLTRAIGYFERAAQARQRLLGNDHPRTLATRNHLASAYKTAGDPNRAIALYKHTLRACKRTLGKTHPNTLATRNDLAAAYAEAGDLDRAIPLYERTLKDRRRTLGDDHRDTLTTQAALADAYTKAGNPDRAIPLLQRTLTDQQRLLGDDHLDTLFSRSKLAAAYQDAGSLDRAIPLLEQTLHDCERILGIDHPNTLAARSNLAAAYSAARDLDRAIPLHERTLRDCERILNIDHPDILGARNNLAAAYLAAGDFDRAVPLLERTFTDFQRVLGNDHPETLRSSNNLATAYGMAGDLDRAIPFHKSTLHECKRVLGDDHPLTRLARENLAAAKQR